jgi:hypothetical protein
MTWNKPATRLTTLVTAALGLAAALPPAASAGSYEALSCDYAPPGGADNNWQRFSVGGGGNALRDTCPSGGDAQQGLYASEYSRNPVGSKHGWEFKTPPGTSLSRFEGKINGYSSGENSAGSGLYSPKNDYGVRYGMNPFQNPRGYGHGPSGDPVVVGLPTGVTTLAAAVLCGGESADCHPNPGSSEAKVSLTAARVTVEDPVNPTLNLTGGTLSASPTQSGTSDITFDASDNVGIKEARLVIDGLEKDRETFSCDYSAAIPCSDQTSKQLTFDSRTISDGAHNARVEILDAAGNTKSDERQIVSSNGSSGASGISGGTNGGSSSTSSNTSTSTESIDRRALTEAPNALFGSPATESTITLKASRRSVKNGKAVAFSGAVMTGTRPFNDVIVALQARVGSRWVTFKNVRTGTAGGFGARYRFTRTFRTRTYTFRARVSKQQGFGVDRNSGSLRVKVKR